MQYKALALLAATAAALPAGNDLPAVGANDKFGLIAIRSGSAVQNTGVKASKSFFTIGGTQDADCFGKTSDFATFSIDSDGNAFLYTDGAPYQKLWVDKSGMGQGIWGYTTGAESAPKNSERTGWSIDGQGYFVFDGMSPQACPPYDGKGAYTVWWSDLEKPAGNENCTGIGLRAVKADDPVPCRYSESS